MIQTIRAILALSGVWLSETEGNWMRETNNFFEVRGSCRVHYVLRGFTSYISRLAAQIRYT